MESITTSESAGKPQKRPRAEARYRRLRACGKRNQIRSFIHCGECLKELPVGTSPREWGQLEVGFTPLGIQVWCKRHERNVMHMDLEGRKHPAV